MNRREAIAGALAVASVGALPPGVAAAAAGPFRVFRRNEYEWYMARSLEEAHPPRKTAGSVRRVRKARACFNEAATDARR